MLLLLIGWPLLIAGLWVFALMIFGLFHPEADDNAPSWELGGRVVSDLVLAVLLSSAGMACLLIHWLW